MGQQIAATRRIAVFSSSRADAGHLAPVIGRLDEDPRAGLVVLVGGGHLGSAQGRTVGEVKVRRGPLVEVGPPFESTDRSRLVAGLPTMIRDVADALERHEVEVLVLLGDRWELLGPATAAVVLGIPIAHVHGGEVTAGAVDDRVRHAVTKLADIHLCAMEEAASRLRQLGEEPSRIHVTGAPGLDRLSEVQPLSGEQLEGILGAPPARPLGLVTYHPPTADPGDLRSRAYAVLSAAADRLGTVVVTFPGADPGAEQVIEVIRQVEKERDNVMVFPHLGEAYLGLLATADLVLGNSSSGLVEAPTFKVPVVNVGDRQAGRPSASNVVHADEEVTSIRQALDKALSAGFRQGLDGMVNPYGDGHAARRIVEVLIQTDLDLLVRKPFVDQELAT